MPGLDALARVVKEVRRDVHAARDRDPAARGVSQVEIIATWPGIHALLAYRMNGAPLPNRHGYPLRVLIPGRYGEENPKWVTRVELTDHFVGGLYADQGWYHGALHTVTRIDRPFGKLPLGHTIEIGGISFAGNRGIQRVEVSTDDGVNWHDAMLQPALSQDSWVFWTWQWTPLLPASYTLTARATVEEWRFSAA